MKIYRIDVMGQDKPTYATQEDIVKIVEAANRGMRLVMVRQTFLNPSSISRISRGRQEDADESNLDPIDEELNALLGSPTVKELK